MTIDKLKESLSSVGARWRVRRVNANSEAVSLLNRTYPGVGLQMQIYCLMNNLSPYCTVCQHPVKTLGKTTCSVACRSKAMTPEKTAARISKARATCLERVGVDNHAKLPGTQEKRLRTMVDIHGAKVSQKALAALRARGDIINTKGRETLRARYGVDNPGQLPGHAEKCKLTNLENFGVQSYRASAQYQSLCSAARWNVYSELCGVQATLRSVAADPQKAQLYDKPNFVISFTCNKCDSTQSMPSETFRWRIRNFSTPCSKCSGVRKGSVKEEQIAQYISSMGFEIQRHCRILSGREIDIFIPSKNIGIEFHGLYWHSDLFRGKYYHLGKHNTAVAAGIKLIQIFEDEWDYNRSNVEAKLKDILCGYSDPNKSITHRCSGNTVEVQVSENCVVFNNALGMWHMSFSPLITMDAVAAGFNHFVSIFAPDVVITDVDTRWITDEFGSMLNFSYQATHGPRRWYIDRIHGVRISKDAAATAVQTVGGMQDKKAYIRENFLRIWDCGCSRWVWTNS